MAESLDRLVVTVGTCDMPSAPLSISNASSPAIFDGHELGGLMVSRTISAQRYSDGHELEPKGIRICYIVGEKTQKHNHKTLLSILRGETSKHNHKHSC